jgi:hypothetical protein
MRIFGVRANPSAARVSIMISADIVSKIVRMADSRLGTTCDEISPATISTEDGERADESVSIMTKTPRA